MICESWIHILSRARHGYYYRAWKPFVYRRDFDRTLGDFIFSRFIWFSFSFCFLLITHASAYSQPPRRRKNSRAGRLRRAFNRIPGHKGPWRFHVKFARRQVRLASLNAVFCGSRCGRHKNSRRRLRPSGVYTDLNCGAPFTLSHPLRPRSRNVRDFDGKHRIDEYVHAYNSNRATHT